MTTTKKDLGDDKLKGCPFCGGKHTAYRATNQVPGTDRWTSFTRCTRCGATGPGSGHRDTMADAERQAGLGWNKRVQNGPTRAVTH